MRLQRTFVVGLVAVLLPVVTAGADTLALTSGKTLVGKVFPVGSRYLVYLADGRKVFVPRKLVARHTVGAVTPPSTARSTGRGVDPSKTPTNDPRIRELVRDIVGLSKEFGILTEYTAFLAREGTDLSRRDDVLAEATRNYVTRGIRSRSGLAAVNQAFNNQYQRSQMRLNPYNQYWDHNMNRVSITSVQQVSDRAFYRRGRQWVDGRIIDRDREARPDRVIHYDSKAFRDLTSRLAEQGRQGTVALRGDILMDVNGQTILVKGPASN